MEKEKEMEKEMEKEKPLTPPPSSVPKTVSSFHIFEKWRKGKERKGKKKQEKRKGKNLENKIFGHQIGTIPKPECQTNRLKRFKEGGYC